MYDHPVGYSQSLSLAGLLQSPRFVHRLQHSWGESSGEAGREAGRVWELSVPLFQFCCEP